MQEHLLLQMSCQSRCGSCQLASTLSRHAHSHSTDATHQPPIMGTFAGERMSRAAMLRQPPLSTSSAAGLSPVACGSQKLKLLEAG